MFKSFFFCFAIFLGIMACQKGPDSTQGKVSPQIASGQTQTKDSKTTGLANPASVYCGKQGGKLVIKKQGDGGEYGVCLFADNYQCEEWALFRGECPKGGIRITGYDTPAQIYCAITGGETLAVPNAKCKLKDGKVCSADAFYNGKCPPPEKI